MATPNSPTPATIGQLALRLSDLSASDVPVVSAFLDHLEHEASREAARWSAVNLTPAMIRERAKERAELLRDVPREQVAARFAELVEEIRQEAIAKGTAIDGYWTGD